MITGASRGISTAFARQLATPSYKLILVAFVRGVLATLLVRSLDNRFRESFDSRSKII